jgi:hypothetical protein
MTQSLLLMLLGEFSLVLLTGLIVLLVVNRRNKRRRLAGIEELLEDIKDRQPRRGDRLALALISKHRLDEQTAQELSENLIAAEKQFLYEFVEQQMQQQAVGGFYENLCRLLDGYLDNMPKSNAKPAEADVGAETAEVPPATGDQAPEAAVAPLEEGPPPPDWGDVFD